MNDSSDTQRKAKAVRRHWFQTLPRERQDAIIEPAFESEHPTNEDKREAVKNFDKLTGRQS